MACDAFTRWLEQPAPPASDEEELMWAAWQASRAQALSEAYDLLFDVAGSKATRFDAQRAIRELAAPADVNSWVELARAAKSKNRTLPTAEPVKTEGA